MRTEHLSHSMRVRGRVEGYMDWGPCRDLGRNGWGLQDGVSIEEPRLAGLPGPLHICDPDDHKDEAREKMPTLLRAPIG